LFFSNTSVTNKPAKIKVQPIKPKLEIFSLSAKNAMSAAKIGSKEKGEKEYPQRDRPHQGVL